MKNLMKIAALSVVTVGTLMAAPATKGVYLGIGTMDVGTESEMVYTLGYDVTKVTDKNIVLGVDLEVEYADFSGTAVWGYGAEGKLGYQPLKGLSVYGILGGKQQGTDTFDAYGWGFGGGVSYDITQSLSLDLKYVDYTMSVDPVGEYDAPKTSLNLRVNF